jgi:outer membrane protein insertion porin family
MNKITYNRLLCLAAFVFLLLQVRPAAAQQQENIDSILVRGNLRIETATILAAITTTPGPLDRENIARDIRKLYDLGFFDNITVERTTVGDLEVLVFDISEKPFVKEVEISGNEEEKEEDLLEKVTIKVKQMIDYAELPRSIDALKAYYAEQGFYIADVSYELVKLPRNEVKIVFHISENRKVMVRRITFIGNEAFEDKELKSFLQTSEMHSFSWLTQGGTFSGDLLERDRDMLMLWYLDHGYINIKIDRPLVSLSADKQWAYVTFTLSEGEQYTVGEFKLGGDVILDEENTLDALETESGEVYCYSCVQRDIQKVADRYGDFGFAFANVDQGMRPNKATRIVDLSLMIDKGKPVYVNRIEVVGNTVTRDKVVRRELRISEGQLYNRTLIRHSERRINGLGFFKKVEMLNEPVGDDRINILINVEEGPTGSASVGVGFSSIDEFFGQAQLGFGNLLGYGVRTNLSAELGPTKQLYSLSYSDPYFLDTKWSAGAEVFSNDRTYSSINQRSLGGALRGGYLIDNEFTRFYLSYRFEDTKLRNLSRSIARYFYGGTTSSLTFSLSYNSKDHPWDPRSGMVYTGSVEYAGKELGGDFEFVKLSGNSSLFFNPYWDFVLSFFGKIGYAFTLDQSSVPYSERYFLGGINSIRAFDYREIGPYSIWPTSSGDELFTTTTVNLGGNKMLLFNVELTFPILKEAGIKGVMFYDAGQAYLEEENYFENGFDLRQGWGLGFRWFSPMGPLRFEWGFPLNPQKGDPPNTFNFSIGTFF